MTNQEAIRIIKTIEINNCAVNNSVEACEEVRNRFIALDMAINALSTIEDIKAEIKEEKECAYADFERYKVDYLGQDWEDVLDSLPQDDYRYGMERCLEIINKHLGKENEWNY